VTALGVVALGGCSVVLGIDKDYEEGDLTGPEAAVADVAPADTRVDETSAGDAGDSGPDAFVPDAGCPGHVCQGVCLAGTSCAGCSEGTLRCAATHACVSACGACSAPSVECWTCPTPSAPVGSCEPAATAYCFGAGYMHCACAGDGGVAQCPGANQTCRAGVCSTCGESGTDGAKCRGNLDCEATKQLCH
jgi:hypothetical protein